MPVAAAGGPGHPEPGQPAAEPASVGPSQAQPQAHPAVLSRGEARAAAKGPSPPAQRKGKRKGAAASTPPAAAEPGVAAPSAKKVRLTCRLGAWTPHGMAIS